MLSAIFNAMKISRRRPTSTRSEARSRRPLVEAMEDRRLLSTMMLINDVGVVEGSGGSRTPVNFTVSLTNPTPLPVTVNFHTVDQSARAWEDYIPTNGQLSFAPGEMTKTITVDVIGDDVIEPAESFYVVLSGAQNGWVIKPIGVATIADDDTAVAPELSISDMTMRRGYSGAKEMTFTVSLNTSVSSPVTVKASTMGITAFANLDFQAKTELLTFQPGETTKEFKVTVFGTSTLTADKLFFVNLSEASLATKKVTGAGILQYGA